MGRVIAVANQKGGVAKTTTVHSLGAALAERGRRVLLVDLDPQAGLTYSAGIDADQLQQSLFDVLMGRVEAGAVLWEASGCDILPAAIDLAGAEVNLVTRTGREHTLARALAPLLDDYQFVLLDCPPSLGLLTVNGLTAAAEVLIPLQPETLSPPRGGAIAGDGRRGAHIHQPGSDCARCRGDHVRRTHQACPPDP